MSIIVGIGATHELQGFALAGVHIVDATSNAQVEAAWNGLDPDVGLVILSPEAAQQLGTKMQAREDLLTVVMP
jgi:vacuolar-type H+-ATPase subunit F/Vma7